MLIHGFLCEIELDEDTLEHYGVKGMKWRYRKRSGVDPNSALGRLQQRNDIETLVDRAKLVGRKGSSSNSKAAKGAGKKAAGAKAAKETKEKEGSLADRIQAVKDERKEKVNKNYLTLLKENFERDRSQLPKARANALELEKRRKSRK